MEIYANSIDDAYTQGMGLIFAHGYLEQSRNGKVYVLREPVTTHYMEPRKRVLLHIGRDANPFFHLMEAMWMLLGRQDLRFLAYYNPRMTEFSDDGAILRGAYGYRWVRYHNFNQIEHLIRMLKEDPTTRRAVLTMWSPQDLLYSSKDTPCNTHIYFRIREFKLDMTVNCRSNDIIWGAYGANSVHFSILQEYVAAGIGIPVGVMHQFSHNFHAYTELFIKQRAKLWEIYDQPYPKSMQMVHDFWSFHKELADTIHWIERLDNGIPAVATYPQNPFLETVGRMGIAWREYKHKNLDAAIEIAGDIPAEDWKIACINWLNRRKKNV